MASEAQPIDREPAARRARCAGRALLAIGVPLVAIGGAALAIVGNVLPLAALLPSRIRVTGPVVADARALFWVAMVPVVGLAAVAQGFHQLRTQRTSWRRFAALIGTGIVLVGAGVLARSWL